MRTTTRLAGGFEGELIWPLANFANTPFDRVVANNARVTVEKWNGTVIVYEPVEAEEEEE